MNADTHYSEIYKETICELEELPPSILFSHCIQTCQRLFSVSEGQSGKPSHNLSDSIIDSIAKHYEARRRTFDESNLPDEKYSYATSAKCFDNEEISLQEFMNHLDSKSKEATEGDVIKKIIRNYLFPLFGYSYSKTEKTNEEVYEIIRLIKILYDCKWDCKIDLAYLQRMSLLQTQPLLPSHYKDAIMYVKERIITRSKKSGYMIPYDFIMKLERYSNSLRSFISTFPERSVEDILSYLPYASCRISRFVRKEIYKAAIDNLHPNDTSIEHIDYPIAIQCYAYVWFSSLGITPIFNPLGDMVGKKFKDTIVEMDENGYTEIEKLIANNNLYSIDLQDISGFIQSHKASIQKIVYPSAIIKSEIRAAMVNISRHQEQYRILGSIYNQKRLANEDAPINARDFILIIYLYEQLTHNHIEIPLSSGYNHNNKRKIKLNHLLNKLQSFHIGGINSHPLSEAEYFLATHWLWDKLFMLMTYQTDETRALMQRMQRMLYEYLVEHIPILQECPQDTKIDLNQLIQKILPTKRRQEILNAAEAMYVEEKMDHSYITL